MFNDYAESERRERMQQSIRPLWDSDRIGREAHAETFDPKQIADSVDRAYLRCGTHAEPAPDSAMSPNSLRLVPEVETAQRDSGPSAIVAGIDEIEREGIHDTLKAAKRMVNEASEAVVRRVPNDMAAIAYLSEARNRIDDALNRLSGTRGN